MLKGGPISSSTSPSIFLSAGDIYGTTCSLISDYLRYLAFRKNAPMRNKAIAIKNIPGLISIS